jgi:hypothetical protein
MKMLIEVLKENFYQKWKHNKTGDMGPNDIREAYEAGFMKAQEMAYERTSRPYRGMAHAVGSMNTITVDTIRFILTGLHPNTKFTDYRTGQTLKAHEILKNHSNPDGYQYHVQLAKDGETGRPIRMIYDLDRVKYIEVLHEEDSRL